MANIMIHASDEFVDVISSDINTGDGDAYTRVTIASSRDRVTFFLPLGARIELKYDSVSRPCPEASYDHG